MKLLRDIFGVGIDDKEMRERQREPRTCLLLSIAHEGSKGGEPL